MSRAHEACVSSVERRLGSLREVSFRRIKPRCKPFGLPAAKSRASESLIATRSGRTECSDARHYLLFSLGHRHRQQIHMGRDGSSSSSSSACDAAEFLSCVTSGAEVVSRAAQPTIAPVQIRETSLASRCDGLLAKLIAIDHGVWAAPASQHGTKRLASRLRVFATSRHIFEHT